MKKIIIAMTCLVSLVWAGFASAIPMSWTDTIDWNPNQYINSNFSYYHDLGNDGFSSLLQGGNDKVTSYELTVALFDDNDKKREKAFILQPGLFDPDTVTKYNFNLSFVDIGWTLGGLLDINHDGTLNVWITSKRGDFYLDWSRLVGYGKSDGYKPTTSVPEPSTLLLMGTILIGFARIGSRRA